MSALKPGTFFLGSGLMIISPWCRFSLPACSLVIKKTLLLVPVHVCVREDLYHLTDCTLFKVTCAKNVSSA